MRIRNKKEIKLIAIGITIFIVLLVGLFSFFNNSLQSILITQPGNNSQSNNDDGEDETIRSDELDLLREEEQNNNGNENTNTDGTEQDVNSINDNGELIGGINTESGNTTTEKDISFSTGNELRNKQTFYVVLSNNSTKEQFENINKYIQALNSSNSYNNIDIKVIKSRKIGNNNSSNNCNFGFRTTNVTNSISIIEKSESIIFSELIKYFNSQKKNNRDKLIIINNNNINKNCNDIETIRNDIDNINNSNNNVIILNNKQQESVVENFFNNLSLYTGTTNVSYDNIIDFRNKINDFIIPVEDKLQIQNGESEEDYNTFIEILDANKNSYQADITIYKQENGFFTPIQEEKTIEKELLLTLDAGIYKFEAFDPVTGIFLETEPTVINRLSPFDRQFIFRKTKFEIFLEDDNGNPIKGDIRIEGTERKDITINNYDDVSSVVINANPGSYKINIQTDNNFVFNDTININGEGFIKKTYKTVKQRLSVSVVDQDNIKIDQALVKIMLGDKTIDTAKGNDLIMNVPLGQYTINAVDVNSGNRISKEINISDPKDLERTKRIKLSLESFPIRIDLGVEGVVVEIYDNAIRNQPLKTFTGTGKKEIQLSIGDYYYRVYNKQKIFKYDDTFKVDDFYTNDVVIK